MSGTLFIVSTPIGNLDDVSPRSREVLESVDLVACEDTRRTGRLLGHLGIKNRLLSLHEHNEARRLPAVLADLEAGRNVALVSDAGTPLLSDPGYRVVRSAVERGLQVVSVPGPSAVLAALVVSGLPPYPFTFAGFPPPKGSRRRRFFERFSKLDHTLVLFESPHRLLRTLSDAREIFGERPVAVAREITKMHEETVRGDFSSTTADLTARSRLKGEFCIVIGAPTSRDV